MGEEFIKKRVACLIPPFYRLIESKNNRIMPAIHYIAQILNDRGHEVILINGDYSSGDYADRVSMAENCWLFDERIKNGHESFRTVLNILDSFHPDTVIISAGDILLPTVESGNAQTCLYLARMIKEHFSYDVKCIGYGHLLNYVDKEKKSILDAYYISEAEDDILNVVEKGEKGERPVSWVKNLDDLPFLSDEYIYYPTEPEDFDYIMSMRGCIFKCNFCLQPALRNGFLSMMSPERFVSEVKWRIEKFGLKDFYFSDMIFISRDEKRNDRMLELLKEVKAQYPDFTWRCESRVDLIQTEDIITRMKEAGCRHIKFGVEMLNQKMLKTMNKGIVVEKIKETFSNVKKADVSATAYVLLGCPGFKDEDYREMFYEFEKLKADNYVVNITVPYVGTKLYEMTCDDLKEKGLYSEEEGFTHFDSKMKDYWGISDETIALYRRLNYVKEDNVFRNYKRKIVNKKLYYEENEVSY